jgi:hypothetical protein
MRRMTQLTHRGASASLLLFTLLWIVHTPAHSQTTYTSTGSGNWSTMVWSPAGSPTASDNVIIRDADAVVLDASISLTDLTIGEGTGGTLTFDGTARTVVLAGNLTVRAGATFITQTSVNATHSMTLGGNLVNDGTFDMSRGGTTLICNVTFNKLGDQTISGTGSLTRFKGVTLLKGSASNKVVASVPLSIAGSQAFGLIAGTWEQTQGTISITGGSQSVQQTGGLEITGTASFNMQNAASLSIRGKFTLNTSETFVSGSGNNSVVADTNSVVNLQAGTMTVFGRLTLLRGTTTISGADIFLDPQLGSTSLGGSSNTFEVSTLASLDFQSGIITFVDPIATPSSGYDIRIGETTGSVNLAGATFIFGSGGSTSTGTLGFRISNIETPTAPIGNLALLTGGLAGRDVSLATNLEITGDLLFSSGFLLLGNNTLTIGEAGGFTMMSYSSFIASNGTGQVSQRLSSDRACSFPLGDISSIPEYSPVTIAPAGGAYSNALVSARVHNVKHPNNTSTTDFLNRYWVLSQSGITGANYTVTFEYVDADLSGNEAGIVLGRWDGAAWSDLGAGAPGSNALFATTSGLGEFTGGEPGALPIQLASFTGRFVGENSVRLEWSTISEINNYGFYVQRRATNVQSFTELTESFVPGHGTTLEPQQYAYTDNGVSGGRWFYRLRQIDLDGTEFFTDPIEVDVQTGVEEDVPKVFALHQNFPNPFNPSTSISFTLEKTDFTAITIYNLLGQEVMRPFSGIAEAGTMHSVRVDGSVLPSGVYFYRLTSGQKTDLRRMLLLK